MSRWELPFKRRITESPISAASKPFHPVPMIHTRSEWHEFCHHVAFKASVTEKKTPTSLYKKNLLNHKGPFPCEKSITLFS